jgi:hypothetical protein
MTKPRTLPKKGIWAKIYTTINYSLGGKYIFEISIEKEYTLGRRGRKTTEWQ